MRGLLNKIAKVFKDKEVEFGPSVLANKEKQMRGLLNKIAKVFKDKEIEFSPSVLANREKQIDFEKLQKLSFAEFIFRSGVKLLEHAVEKEDIKALIANYLKHRVGIEPEEEVQIYYHAPVGYPKAQISVLEKSIAEELKKSPAMVVIPLLDYKEFRSAIVDILRERLRDKLEEYPALVRKLNLGREPLKPQILKKGLFEMSPEEKQYLRLLGKVLDEVALQVSKDLKAFVDRYNAEYPKMERERTISPSLKELSTYLVASVKDELEKLNPKAVKMLAAKIEKSFKRDIELQNNLFWGKEKYFNMEEGFGPSPS
jgi:hypothetical protein